MLIPFQHKSLSKNSLFFRFYEEESELIEAHILEHVFYGYIISKFFDCNKSQPQLTPKVYQH